MKSPDYQTISLDDLKKMLWSGEISCELYCCILVKELGRDKFIQAITSPYFENKKSEL